MKRLAAVLLAATVALGVTGCGGQSEEWLKAKHECISFYYENGKDLSTPKTYTEAESICTEHANKRVGK